MSSLHSSRYRALLRRLLAARMEAGLTQADVAHAFGRPQPFVSKCESGERRIDALELTDFAELYGKPLSFFVTDAAARSGASVVSESPSRPRRARGTQKKRR